MEKSKIIITRKEDLEDCHKIGHGHFEYHKYRIPKTSEASNLKIGFYDIPPKKAGYPYHYHMRDEEVFLILCGEGMLRSKDGKRIIKPGDVIVCPAGEQGAHILSNASDTEVLTYFEVDLAHLPEIVRYPDTEKVGIVMEKEENMFFKTSSKVDYYEEK